MAITYPIISPAIRGEFGKVVSRLQATIFGVVVLGMTAFGAHWLYQVMDAQQQLVKQSRSTAIADAIIASKICAARGLSLVSVSEPIVSSDYPVALCVDKTNALTSIRFLRSL